MKKSHTKAFLAAAAMTIAAPIMGTINASAAATVSYKDFSTLNRRTLNGAYSHAQIYYRENTTIKVAKATSEVTFTDANNEPLNINEAFVTADNGNKLSAKIKEGETLEVLIENSTAMDDNGNDVDVIYRVSDVHTWRDEDSYANLAFHRNIYGTNEETHPANEEEYTRSSVKAGDPIVFWNNTRYADSLFTVQFCKKGTYSTGCVAPNIKNISAAMWDFDVPHEYGGLDDKYFRGNEGIIPQNGNVSIYYNKTNPVDGTEFDEEQNGIAVDNISNGATFNGIWFGNSIITTATGINSSWSYRYTGTYCGIGFLFGSAVPYTMPQPKKAVNTNKAKVGDNITYTITQEVPGNYSSEYDMVTFMSLWSKFDSIPENKGYASLSITDTFQNGVKLPTADKITIENEKGINVTNNFNISVSGQKLTATPKDATALSLYGHIYRITVPATITGDVKISPVENTAKTTYTPSGSTSSEDLDSNTVETEIMRKVVTKHVDDKTGEEIADSTSDNKMQGEDYTTNPLAQIPDGYELVKTPDNAEGRVGDKDVEVIYRYSKIMRKVVTKHVDDKTGEEIADPTSKDFPQGSDYTTNPLAQAPEGYELVKTPDNANGKVGDKDIEVTYRYSKIIRKVTTRHIDDQTGKEIADPTSENKEQGSEYTTERLSQLPKGYELVKIPANAKGTVGNGDVEVIYRYRKIANPKTFDASTGAFIGIIIAGLAGSGLFFGVKRRR